MQMWYLTIKIICFIEFVHFNVFERQKLSTWLNNLLSDN